MQTLRQAHHIARFVLPWLALPIGVAVAAPLVHPRDLQRVCSASGGLKLIRGRADGKAGGTPDHRSLAFPLCTGLAPALR